MTEKPLNFKQKTESYQNLSKFILTLKHIREYFGALAESRLAHKRIIHLNLLNSRKQLHKINVTERLLTQEEHLARELKGTFPMINLLNYGNALLLMP